MKKRIIILIIASILVIGAVASVVYAAFNAETLVEKWMEFTYDKFIGPEWEKIEAENQKKIENGEPVAGKDTRLIWGKMYHIAKYYDGVKEREDLTFSTKEARGRVLNRIIGYKKENGKLYVYSEEGYAVIDNNNLCRVYMIIPPEVYANGDWTDMYGRRHSYSKVEDCDKIQYLSSYEEYSENERQSFRELEFR